MGAGTLAAMADKTQIIETIERYMDCMGRADKEGWLALFHEDATVEDPVGDPVNAGREAIGEFWDMVQGMSDSMELVVTGPVRVAGDEAAVPFQVRSTVGDARLAVDIIDVFAFDADGSIVGMRAFWDPTEMRPLED